MGILSVRFRMCYLLLVIAIAAIAPTVPFPDPPHAPTNQAFFKEKLRYTAKILRKETKAEEG